MPLGVCCQGDHPYWPWSRNLWRSIGYFFVYFRFHLNPIFPVRYWLITVPMASSPLRDGCTPFLFPDGYRRVKCDPFGIPSLKKALARPEEQAPFTRPLTANSFMKSLKAGHFVTRSTDVKSLGAASISTCESWG